MQQTLEKIYSPEQVKNDDRYFSMEQLITTIETNANEITVIKNDSTLEYVEEMGIGLKRLEKDIKAKQKEFTAGAKDTIQKIDAIFKPMLDRITAQQRRLNPMISQYAFKKQQEIEAQRQKELKQAALKKNQDKVIAVTPEAQKTSHHASGAVTYRTIKKWRIKNESKIPRNFLIVDSAQVTKTMQAGIAIPGIEYYEEKVPSYRS